MAQLPGANASTLYLIHALTHATRARLDAELALLGISAFQFTILSVIAENEGLSSSRLSRRFHVTPQAMGEVVLLLERKAMLARTEDPKNRKMLRLSLTERGAEVWREARLQVQRFEAALFAGHSPSEIAALRATLQTSLAALRDLVPA